MNILIFNQKGGVGKTITALNLSAGLARWSDREVTVVDLDPQTHLTAALGFRAETLPENVTHWLDGNMPFTRVNIADKLTLIPGDCNPPLQRSVNDPLKQLSGHVVVDAPPLWNLEVANLMQKSDIVLTPMEPEFLSLQGISRLMQRMEQDGVAWSRLRLLLCRYDERLVVHREVRLRLSERFGIYLLPVVIRNNVRLAESPGYGRNIFDYAPQSTGAQDYLALVNTLLSEENKSTP